MKDKNFPNDLKNKSLNELTELANNVIENLENEKNLEDSMSEYQNLIRLNNLIEKKFKNTSKNISNITKDKIRKILKSQRLRFATKEELLDLAGVVKGALPPFGRDLILRTNSNKNLELSW